MLGIHLNFNCENAHSDGSGFESRFCITNIVQFLLHVFGKEGGVKPYVFHETLNLIGKPSLAEHKIYKSGHYDLIKMKKKKKKKNSTSWDA